MRMGWSGVGGGAVIGEIYREGLDFVPFEGGELVEGDFTARFFDG